MQGRKPTRTEWKFFEFYNLNSKDWLVQKSTDTYLQIINKETKEEKTLPWNK